MRLGYGRVSTLDQNPDAQVDALRRAGCTQVYVDKASGKLARRPQLDLMLGNLRAGDQVVITKLDRLGRSTANLIELADQLRAAQVDLVVLDQAIDTATPVGRMFFTILAAIAEFERALMTERTREGLAAAKRRGRVGGRPRKLSATQAALVNELYHQVDPVTGKPTYTVAKLAAEFGVGESTLYDYLDRATPAPRVGAEPS